MSSSSPAVDLVLVRGRIALPRRAGTFTDAIAISGGRVRALGPDAAALAEGGRASKVIDLGGRTVIPGLSDNHLHFIREGRHFLAELRWDGVTSLAEALDRFRQQAARTPAGTWLRVVGGWSEYQFAEGRLPTADELRAAAPGAPALLLHYYHDAFLNPPALASRKIGPTTAPPPGGEIEHDTAGNPTGYLVAKPAATILYQAIAAIPVLSHAEQVASTLRYMREMNRLGVTSVIDAGGGSQFYPEDYAAVFEVARAGRLTVRTSYFLFPQRPDHELEDFELWTRTHRVGEGDDVLRLTGGGETLVTSGNDYENFTEARPTLDPKMEGQLRDVVRLLVAQRWPFRIHATYGESIERFLNVFEEVNDATPFGGLRWYFDHAETIFEKDLDRVKKLGGGIAIQDRMAFQGEHFVDRYGESAAEDAPPIAKIRSKGIPISGGTDGTRVASYNPWVALFWLVTGRTVGGRALAKSANRLDRWDALSLMTRESAWFSGDEGRKGSLELGELADLAVLSADYFSVPEGEIPRIESVLTVLGGAVVHASGPYRQESPPEPPEPAPAWSPVSQWGGAQPFLVRTPASGGSRSTPGG